ncbi:hypothetical protein ACWEQ2_38240 [Streptomyces sp. NPDC004096]
MSRSRTSRHPSNVAVPKDFIDYKTVMVNTGGKLRTLALILRADP